MPSLVFTTFVPRSSKVAGSDGDSFATLELADKKINSTPWNPTFLLCLIFSITLLVFFISSFTYRILASCKEDKARSSLQSANSRNACHFLDIEKGLSSSHGLKGRISGPTLLFGTSISALNDFVNREPEPRRDMDITEALFEHNETAFLAIDYGNSDAPHRCKHGIDALKIRDDVSPRAEDVQISSTTCSVTESGDSAILEDSPDPFATDAPKHNVIVISNDHNGKCAGHTEDDCYPYRNSNDTCDDDFTVIMTALERLADTFNALESLEKELGTGPNVNGVCYEECVFGSTPSRCRIPNVRETGNTFPAGQEYDKANYLHLDIARPYRPFESKEDARAVLLHRRVELQRKLELTSVVRNPVARDADSYVHATEPELRPPKPMRPESILKEKRCTDASRPSRAHMPVLTSPLASGYVICGPGFSRPKPYRTGSQKPAPLRRKAKSLSPVMNSRHGCGLAHSSSISSQRSSDKLAIRLLKRRQSHLNVDLKASSSSPSVSSNATKAQVGRRRGTAPIAAPIDTSRASPLSVTEEPKYSSRTTHSPIPSEKTTRRLLNAGGDHIRSIGDPGLRSLPAYSDEAAETLSARNKAELQISKTSPRTSICLTGAPLPYPSLISIEHTNHPSNKVLIPSPPPNIQPQAEKKTSPCVLARMQALQDLPKNDNSSFCYSSTPSHNSQSRRTPAKASLRKHRQPSPAPSESRIYRGPPTVARITRRDDKPSVGQNVSLSKNVLHCELAPAVSLATPPIKRRGLTDISNSAVVNRSAASSRYSPLVVRPCVMSTSRDIAAMHSRKSSSSSSDATGVGKNIQLPRRSLVGVTPRSSVFSPSTSALY